MNNRGFTLIELVATIALLAVVSIISYVSITKVIEESKKSDCEKLIMSIKSAAKEYVSDNRYSDRFYSPDVLERNFFIYLNEDLINNKYLSGPIKNPFTGKNVEEDAVIQVKFNDDWSLKSVEFVSYMSPYYFSNGCYYDKILEN